MASIDHHPGSGDLGHEHAESWTEHVSRLKKAGKLQDVVALCRQMLPLPAAFREAAIALRKQIRSARKAGTDYEPFLGKLYDLAVYHEFLFRDPTVTVVVNGHATQYPDYNVAEIADKSGAQAELMCTYEEFGFRKLPLLNDTDGRWLVEKRGEPTGHRSVRDAHQSLWHGYVAQFGNELCGQRREFMRDTESCSAKRKKWWWPF